MTISARSLYSMDVRSIEPLRLEKLEKEFFAAIRLEGGVNKTTWAGRLRDVEEAIEAAIVDMDIRPTQCLDVGASSAISTLDWHSFLAGRGHDCCVTAMDLNFRASIVRVLPGAWVLVDAYDRVLQYEVLGYGFRPRPFRRRDLAMGVALIAPIIEWALRRRSSQGSQRSPFLSGGDARASDCRRQIWLVSPRVQGHPGIELREADIFAPPSDDMRHRFDVIRVANLLNLAYFEEPKILQAITCLKAYCRPEVGLVAVGRTLEDGSNDATIFVLRDGKFSPLRRVGRGSEIEHLVVGR